MYDLISSYYITMYYITSLCDIVQYVRTYYVRLQLLQYRNTILLRINAVKEINFEMYCNAIVSNYYFENCYTKNILKSR